MRAKFLNEKFKFNPRKCNSANSFSRCVHRDKSKSINTLLTCGEHVELFEKTLISSFSSVNTRLPFDTEILSQNNNLKVMYDLKIDGIKTKKRLVSEILKMDKNNQYGNAMTKPLLYG